MGNAQKNGLFDVDSCIAHAEFNEGDQGVAVMQLALDRVGTEHEGEKGWYYEVLRTYGEMLMDVDTIDWSDFDGELSITGAMTEESVARRLQDLLEEGNEEFDYEPAASVKSFDRAGVMTNNEGLVVRFDDGSEFQVTIVQSKERGGVSWS